MGQIAIQLSLGDHSLLEKLKSQSRHSIKKLYLRYIICFTLRSAGGWTEAG